jgi:hypothetical protein
MKLLKIVAGVSVQQHFTEYRVKFRYIPVQSPWWGGSWERLIGVMKSSIKKTPGRALISLEELSKVIKEVQAMINDKTINVGIRLTGRTATLDAIYVALRA